MRLCKVYNKTGYFHTWEHYSEPIPASPYIGGSPEGVFSRLYGIVEFLDGVERVEVCDINFCDDINHNLTPSNEPEDK